MLINHPMSVAKWQMLKQAFRTMRTNSYIPEYADHHERSLNHRYYR